MPENAVAPLRSGDSRTELLAIVDGLCREIHGESVAGAGLDSSLERDQGLDSLARAELLLRIERQFGVRLPEGTLVSASTPRDLLRALASAHSPESGGTAKAVLGLETVEDKPATAKTLIEVLEWHAAAHPERIHVLFYCTADSTETLTYGDLLAAASRVARGLRRHGLLPGSAAAIMLPSGLDFFAAYFGILMAGGAAVPLYPPVNPNQLSEEIRRQRMILSNCQAPILITIDQAKLIAHLLKAHVDTLEAVVTVADLGAHAADSPLPVVNGSDTAFLQYTSGSTGNPKGVILSHANLLANIRAWSQAISLESSDVCVSWLPLYHDMGLIGAWLGSLYNACPLVLMAPTAFLERPERWLRAIHEHHGTISAAPNFAFELCLRQLGKADLTGLDLSSWRLAANGAEPVSADTIERFCTAFEPYGFRRSAMAPVYGLAECSVGLAVPQPGSGPVVDRIQREAYAREGRAEVAAADDPEVLHIVGCGRALPGHAMRVVDDSGRELPERRIGRLQFRGPSATSGYFRNPQETRRLFDGDWLETGDLAYLAGGQVYPTSRIKDLIIRAGRNIHPYEAEEAIGRLPGVRRGCVAVFGVPDPVAGTERLVAVVETREQDPGRRDALRRRAAQLAQEALDTPLDDIVLAPPRAVQKTTSGKIRRAATRERYIAGQLCQPQPARWRQIADILAATLGPGLRRAGHRLLGTLHSIYAWALLVPFYSLVWSLVVLARRPAWSWRLTGMVARLYLHLIGVRLVVEGVPRFLDGPCIAVANHASYIDGLAVMAALKQPFSFVAKRELARQFLAGPYLRAIGTEFVERFDAERSVEDAKRLADLARGKRALFFFPEGTFTQAAGLRPFHLGAFVAATESRLPVVPVAIRGSRHILGDGSWRLRRGTITLIVGEPIEPQGQGWEAAMGLQRTARRTILRFCGEPDLTDSQQGATS